ncbi:hypothetical protein, partial [Leptospira vanthielii]|uniref:hypothetical protein n=1 Tax=Leptospira vanthielii TaxID=293085 RepID=UPI001AEF5EB8
MGYFSQNNFENNRLSVVMCHIQFIGSIVSNVSAVSFPVKYSRPSFCLPITTNHPLACFSSAAKPVLFGAFFLYAHHRIMSHYRYQQTPNHIKKFLSFSM